MARNSLPGSFRDPSGFVFRENGILYRQVNHCFSADYDLMMKSGFHRKAVSAGLLVDHDEVSIGRDEDAYRHLRPQLIPFVSYPYEWSFGQLRDAALLTLSLQQLALLHGLSLKDASAYNVQFEGSRPIFIDSLSFETYREGEPWDAYQQFCRHFLAPLALAAYRDIKLLDLLRTSIDGIPLPLTSRMLPRRTWLWPTLLVHLHTHARLLRRHAEPGRSPHPPGRGIVKQSGIVGLVDHLERAVGGLRWRPGRTEWGDYYAETNYTPAAEEQKGSLLAEFLDTISPKTVWDLGANTGRYSRQASERGITTVAFDADPLAVERNYSDSKNRGDLHLLPLRMDLTNPSPGLGWDHAERASLRDRGPADLVLALALVHHLALGNNVPLDRIAAALARCGRALAIEFVPKADSQVERMLASRQDIFPNYSQEGFERAFLPYFNLIRREAIYTTSRTLYLFESKASATKAADQPPLPPV